MSERIHAGETGDEATMVFGQMNEPAPEEDAGVYSPGTILSA
jgi:F0F1-type ATP synthase beta subunit